jgi:hypothetical protein
MLRCVRCCFQFSILATSRQLERLKTRYFAIIRGLSRVQGQPEGAWALFNQLVIDVSGTIQPEQQFQFSK